MDLPASIKIEELLSIQSSSPRPGCAVAVLKDGAPIFQQCYGLADMEDGVAISPQTLFNIGSMSKQFTAFAIGLLEQEGRLSREDDIRKHLPEIPDYGHPVRIRHLIYHTSGIRNSYPELLWLAEWRDGDLTTFDDVKKLIFSQKKLNFTPGEEFQYSNSNYVLLAEICARVSGTPFRQFCQEQIFKPLGMISSVIHDSCSMLVPERAMSYYEGKMKKWSISLLHDSVIGPTNLYTNLIDLAKWDENFYTGQIGGIDLVKDMCQPGTQDDGSPLEYGWGLDVGASFVHRGWRSVEHGGSQAGYTSHMLRFPELHQSVVVLFNYFMMNSRELALKLVDLFLEEKPGIRPEGTLHEAMRSAFPSIPNQWAGMYFASKIDSAREVTKSKGELCYNGLELDRLTSNRFCFHIEPESQFEFNSGRDDSVSLEVITPNGKYHYVKIPPLDRSTIRPEQYAGRYYSSELDLFWNIEVNATSDLLITRRKYPQTRLTPVFLDAFRDDWQPITDFPYGFLLIFSRNEPGDITGFRVSGGGVRQLIFEKFK